MPSTDNCDTGRSLCTVDMSSPTMSSPRAENFRKDSTGSRDLEEEFTNVCLGSNDGETSINDTVEKKPQVDSDKEADKTAEVAAPSSTVEESSGGDSIKCSQCEQDLPKDSFTSNQLKKKANKRKCKECSQ